MGAFSRKPEVTIPSTPDEGKSWGWEPHETVTIKGVMTVGDAEAMSTTTIAVGTTTPNVSMSNIKMLDAMIVSWNLTDDQNRVASKDERTIALLPLSYFTPIMEAIDSIGKKAVPVSDPLPLSQPSNEPILESLQ